MTPSTSPKKRSLMPSSKLRRSLRGHGHALSPIVQIGKGGVTAGVVKQVEQALADHELVKLRVHGDGPADRFAVAEQLAERPGLNVVQIVGGAILIYKRDPHRPRYEGSRAQPDDVATGAASSSRQPPRSARPAGRARTRSRRP